MEETAVDAFLASSYGTLIITLWHGVLSAPSCHHFTYLAYGWTLASGRQTITTYLWGSGAAQVKHFSRYRNHRKTPSFSYGDIRWCLRSRQSISSEVRGVTMKPLALAMGRSHYVFLGGALFHRRYQLWARVIRSGA